ncbi:MAG: DUF3108 domain-containing protein, partial [Candidatus Bathyarchaeota archaeon]|nr:DUF3108 domain-containing protein [Candidatus Bathyarchaeota archaeon]
HASRFRRFGKKLYAVAAIVVIAVIATALLTPRGAAIIPLTVNYTVGEKMIYNSTETVTIQAYNTTIAADQMGPTPNTIICNSTETVEVVDFDGEYYTLNHTMTLILEQWDPISMSLVEKVNKTGFSSYFFSVGTQQLVFNASSDPFSSYSFISALLARPEVKVGDTWQVPMSTGNSSFGITGNLTVTFGGIQDITVPAGTYEVFKIDFSSNNLSMNLNVPPNATGTNIFTTMNMSISGQKYLEYKTCREIESNIEMTHSYQIGELNVYCNCSSQTKLVQHLQG